MVVDVGAYTGLSASFFATRYPNATIIAIEPDETNFELLVLNTARFDNVHAVHAALWVESGFVSLTDPGDGSWGFRVAESDNSSATPTEAIPVPHSRRVRAVTIDDIMQEYSLDKIDLLKVDVEGSEKEIFANANSWISCIDAICIELHDRFKAGCARSFFKAVDDFPIELQHGEDVLMVRGDSQLAPLIDALCLDFQDAGNTSYTSLRGATFLATDPAAGAGFMRSTSMPVSVCFRDLVPAEHPPGLFRKLSSGALDPAGGHCPPCPLPHRTAATRSRHADGKAQRRHAIACGSRCP